MEIEKRIAELEIELPSRPEPAAVYVPVVLADNLAFVAGQTPKNGNTLLYKGKVGIDLTVEEAYEASKICVLRCLSAIKSEVGDLDKIERIVKLTGFVNSTGSFGEHAKVINGASELLEKIFGDKGRHARAAIGVSTLPGDAAVEIEMIAKIKLD